jgi:hypothetical protein
MFNETKVKAKILNENMLPFSQSLLQKYFLTFFKEKNIISYYHPTSYLYNTTTSKAKTNIIKTKCGCKE